MSNYDYSESNGPDMDKEDRGFEMRCLLQEMLGGESITESKILASQKRCEDCDFPLVSYRITTIGGQLRHATNLCFCDEKAAGCKVRSEWPYFFTPLEEDDQADEARAKYEVLLKEKDHKVLTREEAVKKIVLLGSNSFCKVSEEK